MQHSVCMSIKSVSEIRAGCAYFCSFSFFKFSFCSYLKFSFSFYRHTLRTRCYRHDYFIHRLHSCSFKLADRNPEENE